MRLLALVLVLVGFPVLRALVPAGEARCGEAQSCCCAPERAGTASCCARESGRARIVSPCGCGDPHRPGSFTLPGRLDWLPATTTSCTFAVPVGPLVTAPRLRPESRGCEPEVPPPRSPRV